MQILVILLQPGTKDSIIYAVVPVEKFDQYDMESIDGLTLNEGDIQEELADQIEDIFHRFGVDTPATKSADLVQYIDNLKYPLTINELLVIGWKY